MKTCITVGLAALGVDRRQLSALFITHAHSDHTSGLATLIKNHPIPIYTAHATSLQLRQRMPILNPVLREMKPGSAVELGPIRCRSFPTPHDCPGSVGYTLEAEGAKMALATDLGCLTPQVMEGVAGAHLAVIETNHDVDWVRSGPYPPYLKQRVLGDRGHLSNEMGGKLAAWAVEHGANRVVLAHLSQENNLPAVALAAARKALEDFDGVQLMAAPRNESSGWLEV
jgi:phosphoribosyl 1,2-cyclic phosphodiesterase